MSLALSLALHKIMKMYTKYDHMHKNCMDCALKCTNSHLISSKYYMLSIPQLGIFRTYV